jgi:hypothetical protein
MENLSEWLDTITGTAFVLSLVMFLVWFVRRAVGTKIQSPTLGILNLKGADAEASVSEDREALSSMFSATTESVDAPPACDVLLLYCDIEPGGRIVGARLGLRELIRDAGARVVVVASENAAEGCFCSAKKTGYGYANLVFTLDRKGPVFSTFFRRLFMEMKKGKSMLRAWVKLAPQIPGQVHPDCPDAVFLAEAGQLAFK